MEKLPTLYHRTSKGAINIWTVWADGDCVCTEWGQKDGKMQTSRKKVEQKNIGKSNETSLEEQAILEAKSLWTHKKERKYKETLDETEETIFLPMLALSFEDKKKTIKDSKLYGQPKLDGCRTLAHWKDSEINLMSRSGKSYLLPHLSDEVSKVLPKNLILDGELYIHGKTLQYINKLIRPTKNRHPNYYKIEYHVYDCVDLNQPDLNWVQRMEVLNNFFSQNKLDKIKLVPTVEVEIDKVKDFETECVDQGYEGAVVRLAKGTYRFAYRSSELLKVKSFKDAEFEIVDFTNGVGKFEECIIYICKTKEGKTFNVVPKGTFEDRKQWLAEGPSSIGKMLKVKYFQLTEDNIPQFPVGICIRLEEDM